MDLKKSEVYRGEPKSKPDATLTLEDADMIQMVNFFLYSKHVNNIFNL